MAHAQMPCLSPSRIKVDISALNTKTSKLWVFTDGLSSVAQLLQRTLSMINAQVGAQSCRVILDDAEVPSTAPLSMLRESDNLLIQCDDAAEASQPKNTLQGVGSGAAVSSSPALQPTTAAQSSSSVTNGQHKYAAPQQHRAHFLGNSLFAQSFSAAGRPRKERLDVVGRRGDGACSDQLPDPVGARAATEAQQQESTATLPASKRLRSEASHQHAPSFPSAASTCAPTTDDQSHTQAKPAYSPTSPPSSPQRASIGAAGASAMRHSHYVPTSPVWNPSEAEVATTEAPRLQPPTEQHAPQIAVEVKGAGKKTRRGCRAGRKHKKRNKEQSAGGPAEPSVSGTGVGLSAASTAPEAPLQESQSTAPVSEAAGMGAKIAQTTHSPQSAAATAAFDSMSDALPFLSFGKAYGRGSARSEGAAYEVFSAQPVAAALASNAQALAAAPAAAASSAAASQVPATASVAPAAAAARPRLRASIMGVSRALGMLVAAQAVPAT